MRLSQESLCDGIQNAYGANIAYEVMIFNESALYFLKPLNKCSMVSAGTFYIYKGRSCNTK
jgi:hypothetical protein